MTTRRTTTLLLLAALILATPAVAGPADGEDRAAWSWFGGWLAGWGGSWQEALGLAAASEGATDGDGAPATDEPAPPGGELGPLIGPDGLGEEGPDPEVSG